MFSVITRKLPATGKVKSAVKLTNGKATEVCWVYLVRGVTVTERDGSSWVFVAQTRGVMFYYLTPNGSRVGDYVVFVREPGNPFDPSFIKLAFRGTAVCTFLVIWRPFLVTWRPVINSLLNLLGKFENQGKCSVFCVIRNYYVIFVTS